MGKRICKTSPQRIAGFARGGAPASDNDLLLENKWGAQTDAGGAPLLAQALTGRQSTRVGAVTQNNMQQDPLKTLTNQINTSNAVENSNLTMTEKAALGLGTTSAAASALRNRASALTTLRDGMAAQQAQQDASEWIGGGEGDPLAPTWSRAFAGGGELKETPEQLMARMAQKYGAAPVAETQPAPVVQPPAPQPVKPQGIGGVVGLLKGRHAMIDKAAGYANGGKIKGPGTPTSDSIAATISQTGEPIKVSTEERILSKAQDSLMQKIAQGMGYDNLDQLLEAGTGKPVGPTIKGGKLAAAYGASQDDLDKQAEADNLALKKGAAAVADVVTLPGRALYDASGGLINTGARVVNAVAGSPVITSRVQPSIATYGATPFYDAVNGPRDTPQAATPATTKPAPTQSIAQLPEQPMMMPSAGLSAEAAAPVTQATKPPGISGTITIGGKTRSISNPTPGTDGYVDAQGKPVEKWEQTARYAEAMGVNKRMSDLATKMERDRYARAMQADITNPRVQALAAMNLGRMDKEQLGQQRGEKLAQEGITAGLDQSAKRQTIAQGALLTGLQNELLTADTDEKRAAAAAKIVGLKDVTKDEEWKAIEVDGGSDPTDQTGTRKNPGQVVQYSNRGNIRQPGAQPAASGLPKSGEVRGGYKFKGGDPANKANWEKV